MLRSLTGEAENVLLLQTGIDPVSTCCLAYIIIIDHILFCFVQLYINFVVLTARYVIIVHTQEYLRFYFSVLWF